jgi:hypothetical protein
MLFVRYLIMFIARCGFEPQIFSIYFFKVLEKKGQGFLNRLIVYKRHNAIIPTFELIAFESMTSLLNAYLSACTVLWFCYFSLCAQKSNKGEMSSLF